MVTEARTRRLLHHPGRHDLELCRPAPAVLRDDGHGDRRDHPRTDVVAAYLLDAGIRMPRDADPFEPIAIHTLCLSIRWLSGWKIGRRDLDPVGMQ